MESPGQLYIADQRGVAESRAYRRFFVFNQADYKATDREPFGALTIANDEMLAAAESVQITMEHNGYFILLPITGEVIISDSVTEIAQADAGQAFISYQQAGSVIELINPYESNWINFLYLQIRAEERFFISQVAEFELANQQNRLISIFNNDSLPFKLHIGIFEGRYDALYQLKSLNSRLFAFVITGAFELQGRLLHERDSLALWNLHEADLEALSNNAVIVVLEMF